MRAVVFAVAMFGVSPAIAQPARADLEKDKAAITQAVLDYAEGYYGGEPARMTRAVSPYLTKRGLTLQPDGASFLMEMNADMLIDASHGVKLPPAERRITTEVLGVEGEVASARVFTARFNDYLHLVKRGGAWQIVNVLWHQPPPPATPGGTATAAVEQAVKDFAAALYKADSGAAVQVLHPSAHIRVFSTRPEGRPRVVMAQNTETLAAGLASGRARFPGTLADARAEVLGTDGDIGTAKLTMGPLTTYLHLARQQDRWRIVNVLIYPPAAPGAPATR